MIPENPPPIFYKKDNPADSIRSIISAIEDIYYDLYNMLATVQIIDSALDPKVYKSASEPTLDSNETLAVWEDTSASKYYIVYRTSSGTQVKVEMT